MDKKFTIDYCRSNPVAILVRTSDETEKVDRIFHYNRGYGFGEDDYSKGKCLHFDGGGTHGSLLWAVENNCEIIKATEFLEMSNMNASQKSKWKVGMWVFREKNKDVGKVRRIARITVENFWAVDDDGIVIDLTLSYRPATPEEIKTYLIAEAKRRGFTPENDGGTFISVHPDDDGRGIFKYSAAWQYNPTFDWLSSMDNKFFYYQGKWAVMIPPPKTVKLMFGSIEVECDKEKHIAKTSSDEFTAEQIYNVIGWWNNKPNQLTGKNKDYCISFIYTERQIKLGTEHGSIQELQAIYDALK
jgi:hypothetical protein